MRRPTKIISGGQTGADQGGLVGARQASIATGGWMPKHFMTEAGPQPALAELYGLKEHDSPHYKDRTYANVRDSDGTAWFGTVNSRGYHATRNACDEFEKPFRVIASAVALRDFVEEFNIDVLNVAGNRLSRSPGIHRFTAEIVRDAFRED